MNYTEKINLASNIADVIKEGVEYFVSLFKSKETIKDFIVNFDKSGFWPEFEALVLSALRKRLSKLL